MVEALRCAAAKRVRRMMPLQRSGASRHSHEYEPTREAAIASFVKSWRKQTEKRPLMLKSRIAKRSILFNGKKTSVSLEDEFWNALKEIADKRVIRLSHLVAKIDKQRGHTNLSSALRLFVLSHYQSRPRD